MTRFIRRLTLLSLLAMAGSIALTADAQAPDVTGQTLKPIEFLTSMGGSTGSPTIEAR